MVLLAFLLALPLQQDVPFKSDDEFVIRLDLKFKSRVISNANRVVVAETFAEHEKRTSTEQLPFLTLFVTITENSQGEARYKILKDGKVAVSNKKIEVGKEFKLEIGFTDDAKDKVSGYEHVIYLLSADKKEISKIVITIQDNGDYFVNGQKRGRV